MSDASTALANLNPQPAANSNHRLTVNEVLDHVKLIQDLLKRVMKEGVHYGPAFKGDTKKNLLLPGAQKLCMMFRLVPKYQITMRQLEGDHREYEILTSLEDSGGRLIAQGVGCCCTLETKYRWRQASLKCPNCGKDTVKRSKQEYGGGWYCHAKVGGCGLQWEADAKAITSQNVAKAENTDPADCWNTVLKQGKKRSLVDALITATAAGDIFAQDVDGEDELPPDIAEEKPPEDQAPEPQAEQKKPTEVADDKTLESDNRKLYTELCEVAGKSIAEQVWKAPATAPLRKALLRNLLDAIRTLDETKGVTVTLELLKALTTKHGWPVPKKDQAMALAQDIIRLAKDGK